ncbi:MAG: TfuA-like protein [Thermoproteota archaeon]|nr:TfuA-like protein [Thermoproteota archaeon]
MASKKILQGTNRRGLTLQKPIIFVGPSLSHQKARKIFDADYRAPAKKGDLLMLSSTAFDMSHNESNSTIYVGLIDGLFLQDYPPTPIEVYQLLANKKFRVIGGASLGALRAMELERFGMIGIGKVFELFKYGATDQDDEVAVTFYPSQEKESTEKQEKETQSEAMVDIRYNLFIAYKKNIISERTKRLTARTAKATYFPYRYYSNIIEKTRVKYPDLSGELASFSSYLEDHRQSLKEHDAVKIIKYIKEAYEKKP